MYHQASVHISVAGGTPALSPRRRNVATPKAQVSARLLNSDCRPTIEVTVPSGISVGELFVEKNWLVDLARKIGPRGCEMCLSGRDFLIRERFDDVINVAIPGRG